MLLAFFIDGDVCSSCARSLSAQRSRNRGEGRPPLQRTSIASGTVHRELLRHGDAAHRKRDHAAEEGWTRKAEQDALEL